MPESNIPKLKPKKLENDEPKTAPELSEDELQGEEAAAPSELVDVQSVKDADDTDETAIAESETAENESDEIEQTEASEMTKQPGKMKRFLGGYWHKKKWTIPLTLLIVLGLIFVIPFTRYPILALGLKRSFSVTIVDSKTNTPVSKATVMLDGKRVTTDSTGKATLQAKVGKRTVMVTKQYYKDFSEQVFVGIRTTHNNDAVKLIATGRQVPVIVVNRITGKPVANADVKVLNTAVKTDTNGMATIVLPTTSTTQQVTIMADNYNTLGTNIEVTSDAVAANKFAITPAGKVYFLSNLSGNIDVVSTNLDGTSRKTVVAGTGTEDPNNTVLLASRDWKYLALLSKRDGGSHGKLFLINTSNDQLSTIDEGNADFTQIGWSDHYFIYLVARSDIQNWQPGAQALKSFNADSGKLATLDQTTAEGTGAYDYAAQAFSTYSIIGDKLLYSKQWNTGYQYLTTGLNGKMAQIMSIGADGSGKTDLKDFPISNNSPYESVNAVTYHPQDIYFQVSSNAGSTYYEYKNSSVTQVNTLTAAAFYQSYPTYLVSPSDNQTFWTEARDGKNSLLVGDSSGNNGTQIASLSDYKAYGWFTDNYLLVSNTTNASELYIMPTAGGTALKVTDYYKIQQNYNGYGYGYGGL